MGHIARYCSLKKDQFKKKNWKYHAHATEENESDKERTAKNEDSSEEYVLISSLTGSITHGSDTCLIDIGASKHMTRHKDSLSFLTRNIIHRRYNLEMIINTPSNEWEKPLTN